MSRAAALREQAIGKLYEAQEALDSGKESTFDGLMTEYNRLDRDFRMAAIADARASGQDTTILPGFGSAQVPTTPEGLAAAIAAHTGKPSGSGPSGPRLGGAFPGYGGGGGADGSWGRAFVEARSHSGILTGSGFQAAVLAPGSTAVAVPLRIEPIVDARRARFIAQLLTEQDAPTGQLSYMRQTVRQLNAAVVAAGAAKPISTVTLEKVEDSTKVIAHISEPISRFDLADAPSLMAFIDSELQLGLYLAFDTRIVAALLAAATQGEATLDLAGIRKAITTLQIGELEPSGIVCSPTSWEAIEAEAIATFAANGNMPAATAAMARRLYDVPVVVTNSISDDVAIVGDFVGSTTLPSAEIWRTGDVMIDLSDSTPRVVGEETVSDFRLNQIVARAEFRREIAVGRPAGFVVVGAEGS